ncbi:hypothetical protein AB1Y20_004627 [Prymnesium parvum]|uniref:Uncharacterized protein n=1 Tax=Prymnesium parvum TaxID=97485 RepID=A0AB34IZB9_PRYPA|mmetsp:Transcript_29617/g.74066  ORF Transcript_29617/g.74066 Transcript_29617/m.74066 type:complete len:227 (+) Transcript_29617:26-706(+)
MLAVLCLAAFSPPRRPGAPLRAPAALAQRRCDARTAPPSALQEDQACVLLPFPPFPGDPPVDFGGEMSLQEMEDSASSVSQVFLNPDGTVSFGATDGPPPVDTCGLWQCGAEEFQMTLQRRFAMDASILGDGPTYTVTRLYRGQVNKQAVAGLNVIEGRIDLYDAELAEDPALLSQSKKGRNVWSGEVLSGADSLSMSAPIGYFTIDKAAVELYDGGEAAEAVAKE